MLARLLLLFITVPLVELILLLWLAKKTDPLFTLMLVIVTGIVGAWLARVQGWRTYRRIQQELSKGRMPTESLWDAVMIFVAGAFLLTPGVLTDLFGLSLLVPACRRYYQRRLVEWVKSNVTVQTYPPRTSPPTDQIIDSYVIDRDSLEAGDEGSERGEP